MDSVRIINKKDVKDECVLIEFLYRKAMCIVEDGEEIIFYHNIMDKNPKYEFTDRYLYDDRKKLFDTDDIALQKVRIGLKKYIKAKAILDYDKEYTVISIDIPRQTYSMIDEENNKVEVDVRKELEEKEQKEHRNRKDNRKNERKRNNK